MQVYVFGTSITNSYSGVYGNVARFEFNWDGETTEGMSGRSYAIPIFKSNGNLLDFNIIRENVCKFKIFATINPDKVFLISRMVGFRHNGLWSNYYDVLFKKLPENCIPI